MVVRSLEGQGASLAKGPDSELMPLLNSLPAQDGKVGAGTRNLGSWDLPYSAQIPLHL